MGDKNEKTVDVGTFACVKCGADLKYKPGSQHLKCQYCGAENEIPEDDTLIEELDFKTFLAEKSAGEEQITEHFVKCDSCGASSTLDPNITSASCPYCSSPLVVENGADEQILKPKSLLPFKLEKLEAQAEFKKWVKKLWFAPNKLKKATLNFDHFKGVYIPYWTYDTDTDSKYTGQRGEHYYVTESYSTTENGKSVTKTRQVQKTRWHYVSGSVNKFFDDILTVASKSLPQKYVYKLEPWDLENLVPFDKKYLSGFIAEKYQVGLEEGFEIAKGIAEKEIRELVRRQIGGDEQRISTLNTSYRDIKFKHLLLPVYVSAYKYKEKLYRFLVNARTGEVQGERPWSWLKIAGLVLLVVAIIAVIVILVNNGQSPEPV
jgi:LSD1 subclass zinc finger protein